MSSGVIFGYGKTLNDIYFGIEVSGNIYDSNVKNYTLFENGNINEYFFKIRKRNDISSSLRIGKQFNNILPYIRAGIVSTVYSIDFSLSNGINDFSLKQRKRINQFELGGGLDYLILDSMLKVATGIEYSHKFKSSFNFKIKENADTLSINNFLDSDNVKLRLLFIF